MQNDDFTDATRMFHAGDYEEGLQKISNCILINPEHSMLYSNRALFYYQMKSHEKAIQDLQTAIQINYLNYIAYFNLFSIELRVGGLEREALEDLCCSLSILYFLRGKNHKTEIDVQKSLKYCENNIEAHILKGMMHLENNKLKLATNQIDWALQFEPQNIVLKRLKFFLNQKLGYIPEQDQQIQPNPFLTKEIYKPQKRRRLQCSLEIDENIIFQQQISQRLQEFTQIYNDLNFQTGTVTQRILIENDQHHQLQTSILSQVSGIWQGKNKQKIFMKNQAREQIFNRKNNKCQHSQVDCSLQAYQDEVVIYDNIILKQFDPAQEEDLLQNEPQVLQHQLYNQITNLSLQMSNDITNQQTNQKEVERRPSQRHDYFVLNEREDLYPQSSQKQQSIDIPYQILNKQYNKKEEQHKQSFSPIEYLEIKQTKNQPQFIDNNLIEIQEKFQKQLNEFILPEPQSSQRSLSKISQKLQKYEKTPSKHEFRLSEGQITQDKRLTQLEQTGNTGYQADQLSDAILSYSSQTKILSNYGQILTKQNRNIKFHQSEVMQKQFQLHEVDQNGQITLIDDLISESSQKYKDPLEISGSFTKKDSLQQSTDRVVKSLDTSMKKKDQISAEYQNQTKTQESQKSIQKFQIAKLYPFSLPKKQIFFNFSSVQFSKKYKITQLDELYLVGVYHLTIPKYKMKTQPHKMDGTFCHWNQKFPQMNLLEQPRALKITVFNKTKGRNARDQLIGQAEKQITETGEIRLPLYQKKLLVGYVKYAVWMC